MATAACPASAVTSSTVRREYGTTCCSTSAGVDSTASNWRLRLISWRTPITSSLWSFMGMTSIDLVR